MPPIAIADTCDVPVKDLKPATASSDLMDRSSLLHLTSARPRAVSATGLEFTLSDGRVILDAASGGAAVACIGMGNQEVVQAMTDQAGQLAYAYQSVLGNDPAEELANWLVDRSDGAFERAAFLNSGSEAMEAVIKLCRQYWVERGEPQRKYIIARFPSYHGNTLGALAVSNIPARCEIYEPLFGDFVHHVTSPNYRRGHLPGESEEMYSARLATELEVKIEELGPENVIAFIAEPVVGSALGIMPPPKGYFPAINAVVRKYGLLLAMDEVMSGSGRVGELFAHQAVAEGVKPDIAALAKGLGGGYVPISAILLNANVAAVIRKAGWWKSTHTYQNHPVCCAAALKVMHIIERDDLLANVRERGEELRDALRNGLAGCRKVLDIRGAGLFIAVELDGAVEDSPRLAQQVAERCFDDGLLVLSISGSIDGKAGEAIILAPAYTVTSGQVQEIARRVCRSIREVTKRQ